MARYRKKPVVIEAVQYDGSFDCANAIVLNLKGSTTPAIIGGMCGLYIQTLEGDHHVSVGDFVITGVAGESYPCKPDIFHASYEPV